MDFILKPYGKGELYNELVSRGYTMSYDYFRIQLTASMEYSSKQLEDFKRRKTLTIFEVERYIEECGLPKKVSI